MGPWDLMRSMDFPVQRPRSRNSAKRRLRDRHSRKVAFGSPPPFLPTRHGFDEFSGIPYSNDMWPSHPEAKKGTYPPLPFLKTKRWCASPTKSCSPLDSPIGSSRLSVEVTRPTRRFCLLGPPNAARASVCLRSRSRPKWRWCSGRRDCRNRSRCGTDFGDVARARDR